MRGTEEPSPPKRYDSGTVHQVSKTTKMCPLVAISQTLCKRCDPYYRCVLDMNRIMPFKRTCFNTTTMCDFCTYFISNHSNSMDSDSDFYPKPEVPEGMDRFYPFFLDSQMPPCSPFNTVLSVVSSTSPISSPEPNDINFEYDDHTIIIEFGCIR